MLDFKKIPQDHYPLLLDSTRFFFNSRRKMLQDCKKSINKTKKAIDSLSKNLTDLKLARSNATPVPTKTSTYKNSSWFLGKNELFRFTISKMAIETSGETLDESIQEMTLDSLALINTLKELMNIQQELKKICEFFNKLYLLAKELSSNPNNDKSILLRWNNFLTSNTEVYKTIEIEMYSTFAENIEYNPLAIIDTFLTEKFQDRNKIKSIWATLNTERLQTIKEDLRVKIIESLFNFIFLNCANPSESEFCEEVAQEYKSIVEDNLNRSPKSRDNKITLGLKGKQGRRYKHSDEFIIKVYIKLFRESKYKQRPTYRIIQEKSSITYNEIQYRFRSLLFRKKLISQLEDLKSRYERKNDFWTADIIKQEILYHNSYYEKILKDLPLAEKPLKYSFTNATNRNTTNPRISKGVSALDIDPYEELDCEPEDTEELLD